MSLQLEVHCYCVQLWSSFLSRTLALQELQIDAEEDRFIYQYHAELV